MAEFIEVVIKMEKNEYLGIKSFPNNTTSYPVTIHLYDAVRNGTPLPKGHGDLKDTNSLKHAFISWSMAVQGYFTDADIASIICNSPTIIEADKAESEDKDDT